MWYKLYFELFWNISNTSGPVYLSSNFRNPMNNSNPFPLAPLGIFHFHIHIRVGQFYCSLTFKPKRRHWSQCPLDEPVQAAVDSYKIGLKSSMIFFEGAVTALLTWLFNQYINIVQSCFNILHTAWWIDRVCSRMLEHAKPDLIQQPSSWLL